MFFPSEQIFHNLLKLSAELGVELLNKRLEILDQKLNVQIASSFQLILFEKILEYVHLITKNVHFPNFFMAKITPTALILTGWRNIQMADC